MKSQDLWARYDAQPEYLKTWVEGLSGKTFYHVILNTKNFAIVQCDGHSWYNWAFGAQMLYAPVEYTLISKTTKNYWYDRGLEIKEITGRLNKQKRQYFQGLLDGAEASIKKGIHEL